MPPRVVITRPMYGPINMQVCAAKDATDEEILMTCNEQNPAGTINGWCIVYRQNTPEFPRQGPVVCSADSERLHFIIGC